MEVFFSTTNHNWLFRMSGHVVEIKPEPTNWRPSFHDTDVGIGKGTMDIQISCSKYGVDMDNWESKFGLRTSRMLHFQEIVCPGGQIHLDTFLGRI
jgi:hypothetical protein